MHTTKYKHGKIFYRIYMQALAIFTLFKVALTCVETTHVPWHQHCWQSFSVLLREVGSQMRWRGWRNYHWGYALQQVYWALNFAAVNITFFLVLLYFKGIPVIGSGGPIQPLAEMSTRNLPGCKGRLERKADLTVICYPTVYKMLEPQCFTTLWASMPCYRDSFYLFFFFIIIFYVGDVPKVKLPSEEFPSFNCNFYYHT
jgi:hypothetical protein